MGITLHCAEKGSWIGEPYLTHQGIANKGTSKMAYGGIDRVTRCRS
jgi:hypothetical protein